MFWAVMPPKGKMPPLFMFGVWSEYFFGDKVKLHWLLDTIAGGPMFVYFECFGATSYAMQTMLPEVKTPKHLELFFAIGL